VNCEFGKKDPMSIKLIVKNNKTGRKKPIAKFRPKSFGSSPNIRSYPFEVWEEEHQ
jgi:hypothetical protein